MRPPCSPQSRTPAASARAPLYLTLVGGGAFGNQPEWIAAAMERAFDQLADSGLDARIVHYSRIRELLKPRMRRRLPPAELRRERKWTRFPQARTANLGNGATLLDFFAIKRGIATGANRFFIMDKRKASELFIPSRFLRPVLPSAAILERRCHRC